MGDESSAVFNRRVGELLRDVRKRRGLALQEVEAQTDAEFRASVVGAYERGERALSLPRLARLAEFYEVPIGRLLPGRGDGVTAADETPTGSARLTIDIAVLAVLEGDRFGGLQRFLRTLQLQRRDLRGSLIAVRHSDRPAIAALLDVPVDELEDCLTLHGLLVPGGR